MLAIAAEGYGEIAGIEPEAVRARFLAETGYATAKVGADAAIFRDDDRILLLRRADDGKWGLVSGWVDPDESPEQTLVREIAEEIGVRGRVDQLVGAFARPAGTETPHGTVSIVYLCSIESNAFRLQPHEVLEVAWHEIESVTDWHHAHGTWARVAREAWWRFRAGL